MQEGCIEIYTKQMCREFRGRESLKEMKEYEDKTCVRILNDNGQTASPRKLAQIYGKRLFIKVEGIKMNYYLTQYAHKKLQQIS